MFHKRRTNTLALVSGINANHRQVPAWFLGVICSHCFKYRKHFFKDFILTELLELARQGFGVWIHSGRQPHSHTTKALGGKSPTMVDRTPGEGIVSRADV